MAFDEEIAAFKNGIISRGLPEVRFCNNYAMRVSAPLVISQK
jgi:hypothetical protein